MMAAGCATISSFEKTSQARKDLLLAENLTRQSDYEGALKAYDGVLKHCPKDAPGDDALFHRGLIWAHPDNPGKDYKKALASFRRLGTDFPASPFRNQAMAWVSVLEARLQCEGRIKTLEDEVSRLKRRLNSSTDEATDLSTRLNALKEECLILKARLHALKEIDIGIEEKKRERRP
jgi:tetratricopeptide (TPR) repeat protein